MYRHWLETGLRDPILTRSSSLLLIAALWLGLAGTAFASSVFDLDRAAPEEILLAQRAIADSATASASDEHVPPPVPVSSENVSPTGTKSAALGVLYSLVLPGAGHIYAGKMRGFVNMGVDVISWIAYAHYRDMGKSKERDFQNYADAHWSRDRWLASGCAACYAGSPEDSLIQAFHAKNTQQYYEDIGKISTYFGGWDDYVNNESIVPDYRSANRRFYYGIRNQSNQFLQDANYGLITAMVNRVVSAVDVFRILRKRVTPDLGNNTQLHLHLRTPPFSSETRIGFEVTRLL